MTNKIKKIARIKDNEWLKDSDHIFQESGRHLLAVIRKVEKEMILIVFFTILFRKSRLLLKNERNSEQKNSLLPQ